MIGKHVHTLSTPAFVVDRKVVEKNCEKLLAIAKKNGISLRGHVKTHKTIEAGIMQTGGTKR